MFLSTLGSWIELAQAGRENKTGVWHKQSIRAIFVWVSKMIRVSFSFHYLAYWLAGITQNSNFLDQSESNTKNNRRLLTQRLVLRAGYTFEWFTGMTMSLVVCQSNLFAFGVRHSIENGFKVSLWSKNHFSFILQISKVHLLYTLLKL